MPSHPVWFSRVSSIVGELRALDADYLDRQTIERIFGIRQRRARQLMAGLPNVKVGNAIAVSRKDLINSLETASDSSKNSREGLAVCAVNRPATVSQKLPDGIRLYPGELRLRFTTPTDLASKLSVVSLAIRTDWDAFAAQIEAETSLRLTYYPRRDERWPK